MRRFVCTVIIYVKCFFFFFFAFTVIDTIVKTTKKYKLIISRNIVITLFFVSIFNLIVFRLSNKKIFAVSNTRSETFVKDRDYPSSGTLFETYFWYHSKII